MASLFGNQESLSTLNAVNMLGYTNDGFNHQLGRGIWGGGIKAKYADLGDAYGRYDSNNPMEILLNSGLVGMGMEEAAMLASAMSHEGTHAAGNRYEAGAHEQGLGTYADLLNQFGLTGNAAMVESMINALNDPSSYIANSGDVQNWLLKFYDNGMMELIDDDRSSLYIEDTEGGEFKLWDLERYSKEAAEMLISDGGQFGGTMLRLGMYAILNANGLFNEGSGRLNADTFNILAENSTHTPGLGYYLDFQSIGLELQATKPLGDGPIIENPFASWFLAPDNSFNIPRPFDGGSLLDVFVFGTMEQYDYHVNVEDPTAFNENGRQNNPEYEYHAETEDGNFSSAREQFINDQQKVPMNSGNGNYYQRIKETLRPNPYLLNPRPDNISSIGNALISMGQLAVGAANASSIGDSFVSTWNNIFGYNFYTIQTANYVADYNNRMLNYTYTFMSPTDKYFEKYVKQAQKKFW